MVDIRCKYCNWLNKEVQNTFICRGCKKENVTKEKIEVANKEDFNIQSKSKRR